jgi:hypothetical protein
MSLFELKTDLVDALNVTASKYAYVPETVIPPAVVVLGDSPFLEPNLIGDAVVSMKVNFTITCAVAYASNVGAVDNLEKLIMEVLASIPVGYEVGNVTQPMPVRVGPSTLLAADIPVSTQYTEGA